MALHSTLPIYKAASDLLKLTVKLAKNFPRDVKPLVGRILLDECVETTTLISRANRAAVKSSHLEQLVERLEVVEVWMRVAVDERWVSRAQYADAVQLTSSIGKQANGWRKHYAKSPAV